MSEDRDERNAREGLQDVQLTGDDPMMKRAEMMATGGDARSLGEPEPPGNPVDAPVTAAGAASHVHDAQPGDVIPATDFEPDASQ